MNFFKLYRYLIQIIKSSPRVTLYKACRKAQKVVKLEFGRVRMYWSHAELSDADFVRALDNEFTDPYEFLQSRDIGKKPVFFLDSSHQDELITALQTCCPDSESVTISSSEKICEHIFEILGSGATSLGEHIDWHIDFKADYRFDSSKYYADIHAAAYPGGYDIKVPWELSRCQHFVWLGQSYWFTNNEKYAQEFTIQISSWIQQNPPMRGVNWACTMEVAIRAVNWLWGYYFFRSSPSLTNSFKLMFFKSLLIHGRHIINNLEWSETLTHNHYLSNVVGLVFLGILLPEFKEAERWRIFGLQELENEMYKQVYVDGVDFEASTCYHRLATELFLFATILASRNGHQFSSDYMQRLEKMLEVIVQITKPDGTAPHIGDSDNGRLQRLKNWPEPEREWIDFRYLLAIGAVLFQRQDFAVAAGDQWEEAIWVWGKQAIEYQQRASINANAGVVPASAHFPSGGLYVMRFQHHYAIINACSNGQNGNGGHAHNDKLSFELFTQGRTWLVDPSSYIYTAEYDLRNTFRSTRYHNTIEVAGQEQNRFAIDKDFIFQLQNDADTHVYCWQTNETYDLFIGEHQGYMRLPNPTLHRRIIFFDKSLLVWVVQDRLIAPQQSTGRIHFHFAPDLQINYFPQPYTGVYATDSDNKILNLFAFNKLSENPQIDKGWVSKGYGLRAEAGIVMWRWPDGATQFTVALSGGDINMAYRNAQVAIARLEAVFNEAPKR